MVHVFQIVDLRTDQRRICSIMLIFSHFSYGLVSASREVEAASAAVVVEDWLCCKYWVFDEINIYRLS